MSNNNNQQGTAPEANVVPNKSISKIWLVPLLAILVGAWMVYFQITNQGQEITIYFDSAEGLEAGKTKIRTSYVDVGQVTQIQLREGTAGVAVNARINKDAEHLLREDSNFWIVTPRVSLAGVSGLSTLLSGPFIELAPGMSGSSQLVFEGLPEPPLTAAGTPGLHITLNSDDEFAYREGDPVIYKGLTVGKFEDIYFNLEERVVYYNVFIRAPYHRLITTTTRFWDSSGVRFNLGTDGLSLQTGNVETLLTNGVSFGIPEGSAQGTVITERAYFDIHESYQKAVSQRFRNGVEFALMVEDSVRGLRVGAPVEYRGLHIGEVTAVNPENEQQHELLEDSYKIPVLFVIQPGRVGLTDDLEGLQLVEAQIELWLEKGLRASLKTGNLLTGAEFVDIEIYDGMPEDSPSFFQGHRIVPMIPDQFGQITEKLTAILDKVNGLPIEATLNQTGQTLEQFGQAAQRFEQTGQQITAMLQDVEQQELIAQLNATLAAFNYLAESYASDSHTNRVLNETMMELEKTLLELKPILDRLNKQPNSLIFSSGAEQPKITPRAKQND